jgi:hypothetical protein
MGFEEKKGEEEKGESRRVEKRRRISEEGRKKGRKSWTACNKRRKKMGLNEREGMKD